MPLHSSLGNKSETLSKTKQNKTKQNKTKQNKQTSKLLETAKSCAKRKVHSINAYIKKSERAQTDNLSSSFKEPEKQKQTKPKPSRMKEIIKIRVEINEMETKNAKDKLNKKAGSLKK